MWKMCLHGSFLQFCNMSSLQMMHTVFASLSSSSVASAYLAEKHSKIDLCRMRLERDSQSVEVPDGLVGG